MLVTRFAPSPTGLLHLGHAFSALTAFSAAHGMGGRFILRIEDIDHTRCRRAFEAALLEDLAWLGLTWETPVRRQSDHMAEYAAALGQLIDQGLVYRCFKTRKEIAAESAAAPHGLSLPESGAAVSPAEEDQRLASGAPFAWRLSLARCRAHLGARWGRLGFEADGRWTPAAPERLGEAILARKDFPASYHLASVWDDALQGVTHVIRGEDLAEAAHLHVLLQALLELPTPRYRHHRLLTGTDGKRLAKRDGAASLASLRAAGQSPAEIRARLGFA